MSKVIELNTIERDGDFNTFDIALNDDKLVSGQLQMSLKIKTEKPIINQDNDYYDMKQGNTFITLNNKGERSLKFPDDDHSWIPIPSNISQQSNNTGILKASSLLPILVNNDAIIIETNYEQGIKHELYRSNCKFFNATELPLQVIILF